MCRTWIGYNFAHKLLNKTNAEGLDISHDTTKIERGNDLCFAHANVLLVSCLLHVSYDGSILNCRLCPNAMRIMQYMVAKLNAARETEEWLSVRLSYGMNGILLPTVHLHSFAEHLRHARLL